MKIKEALSYGKKELSHIEYANIEANILLCYALNVDRLYIMLNDNEELSEEKEKYFKELVEKRKQLMPIAYITGVREFYGRDFLCKKGVLIPRTDTETLIDECLKNIKENQKGLEIGVGTGIISITLLCEKPTLTMKAVDIDDKPLELAKENGEKWNVTERFTLLKSDIFSNINKEEKYDFIVSNPPYIESHEIPKLMSDVKDYEPHLALDGHEDGLYFYRKISEEGYEIINSGGFLAFEIGYNQGITVPDIMKKVGYEEVKVIKDLQGNDRVVFGRKP